MRIVSPGLAIASSRAPLGLGLTAIQIDCMPVLVAARIDARLRGGALEQRQDDRADRRRFGTLIRYFLRQKLGPRPMTRLAIGAAMSTCSRRVEATAHLSKLLAATSSSARGAAVGVTAVARTAKEEDLTTGCASANDEAKRGHGRAARKVGHSAAAVRDIVAITAA